MSLFEEAVKFALNAHQGMQRKTENIPYILHPLEAAVIAAAMTDDVEVLAAAVLHDTVEDTSATLEDIRENFGERVAWLVASETEEKRPDLPASESWKIRKEESLEELRNTDDPSVKILWMGDKLSNLRSLYKSWIEKGDLIWQSFNQKDPSQHAWYYRQIESILSDFKDSAPWQELHWIIKQIFDGK